MCLRRVVRDVVIHWDFICGYNSPLNNLLFSPPQRIQRYVQQPESTTPNIGVMWVITWLYIDKGDSASRSTHKYIRIPLSLPLPLSDLSSGWFRIITVYYRRKSLNTRLGRPSIDYQPMLANCIQMWEIIVLLLLISISITEALTLVFFQNRFNKCY